MAFVFANRGALKAALVAWLAEGNPDTDTLDRSIALVEADLRRRLRIFRMEKTTDLELKNETLITPSRFLSAQRLYIPGHRPIDYLTPEQLIEHQTCHSGGGRPLKYTLEGAEDSLPYFRFSPVTDVTYTLRLTYIADPALAEDDDCNDILDNYPDVYLYGALSHLGDYVRNKERLPDWTNRYKAIIAGLIDSDLVDKVSGSTLAPKALHRVA